LLLGHLQRLCYAFLLISQQGMLTDPIGIPRAGYASKIAQRGGIVAVFNIERSKGDENAHFLFLDYVRKLFPYTFRQGGRRGEIVQHHKSCVLFILVPS